MPEPAPRRIAALAAFPLVTLLVDGGLLLLLHPVIGEPALLRLLTLGAAVLAALAVDRLLFRNARKPAGYWPLATVAGLISYGIYAVLAHRMPEIQPAVILAAAWIGPAAFVAYGLSRMARWR